MCLVWTRNSGHLLPQTKFCLAAAATPLRQCKNKGENPSNLQFIHSPIFHPAPILLRSIELWRIPESSSDLRAPFISSDHGAQIPQIIKLRSWSQYIPESSSDRSPNQAPINPQIKLQSIPESSSNRFPQIKLWSIPKSNRQEYKKVSMLSEKLSDHRNNWFFSHFLL